MGEIKSLGEVVLTLAGIAGLASLYGGIALLVSGGYITERVNDWRQICKTNEEILRMTREYSQEERNKLIE